VHRLIADSDTSAWSFGGSILTFVFPMILFIVVAVALYVLYTKPEMVPGHRVRPPERPVSYTALPGVPSVGPGQAAQTEGGAAAETGAGEAAKTEDAE